MTSDFEGYIFFLKWFVSFQLWQENLCQISQRENEYIYWRKIKRFENALLLMLLYMHNRAYGIAHWSDDYNTFNSQS